LDLRKFKPSVRTRYLLLILGLMWMAVGIMLNIFAFSWLAESGETSFPLVVFGIVAALIIHHFGLLRIVDKNLGRIRPMNDRPCVFAFMSWKSYLLVAIMIGLGITLRHTAIPRKWISLIYIAMGSALFLSSIRYFRYFLLSPADEGDAHGGPAS